MADHEPRLTGTKVCRTCGEEKHVLAFNANRRSKDGLLGSCRDCRNKKARRQRHRESRKAGKLNPRAKAALMRKALYDPGAPDPGELDQWQT